MASMVELIHDGFVDDKVALKIRPRMPGVSIKTMLVSHDQYGRIMQWRRGEGLIQEMLPDFTAEQREMLLSGMDDEEWAEMVGEDIDIDEGDA